MRCDIIDSGIGMTDDQLGRLFSPFVQADESMARRFGGTGLGLSISRRLARLLGGDIVVNSQQNVGSTFTLLVDSGSLEGVHWHEYSASVIPRQAPVRPAMTRLKGRILLAEDGPDNQVLIGSFLRKQGAEVIIVDNGRRAVDAALASRNDATPYTVILMDMQMPVLDGYSATRELRDQGWTGPILALTANAMQGDRQRCLEAGCDDFATKPINRGELVEKIQVLISDGNKPTESQERPPADVAASTGSNNLFDRSAALALVGGDEELLAEIAGMLLKLGPEWLEELKRHLQQRDVVAIRRAAHSLKNSAENLGGRVVAAELFQLEKAAASGNVDDAIQFWPECRDQFQRLLSAVEKYLTSNTTAISGTR
jgi:CheY-like chemotaxis protein